MRGAEVEDRSLLRKDLRAGQLPAGPRGRASRTGPAGPRYVSAATKGVGEGLPAATPAHLSGLVHGFILPSGGPVALQAGSCNFDVACTSGMADVGLYVDDVPIKGTKLQVTATAAGRQSITLVGTTSLAAGTHTMQFGFDCPGGDFSSSTVGNRSYVVTLTGAVG